MFELGNTLREARLRRELDFAAAEQATKIRGKYLRALEEEQFDSLPAETYVKGFLRAYADFLGLDGQLYVDEYSSRYSSAEDVLERRVRSPHPRPRRQPRRMRRLETNVVMAALAAIGIVTMLVFVAWRFGGGSQDATLPLQRGAEAARDAGLFIRAASGSSWLVVRRDSVAGKLLYQGTLEKGQSLRFPTGRVWLNIGSPEKIAMRLNGRPVVVGGAKPRSLIVTADDIYPAGPDT